MTLQSFIENYGYAAVFIGTFLEGETILVMAGFAAYRGYLDLPLVIATAFAASFIGDQCYFLIGQRYGNRILLRFPSLVPRAHKVQSLLHRFHAPLILGIRFVYGLRVVGPIAIGMSHVPWRRFLFLNIIGAFVWAMAIAIAGYLFGSALELLLADLRYYEAWILGVLFTVGLLVWVAYRLRNKGR